MSRVALSSFFGFANVTNKTFSAKKALFAMSFGVNHPSLILDILLESVQNNYRNVVTQHKIT